jgi:hypothetical protein
MKGKFISVLVMVLVVIGCFVIPVARADDSVFEIAGGVGRGLNDLKSTEGILLGAWIMRLSSAVELRIEPNVEYIAARSNQSMFFAGVSPVFRLGTSGKSLNPFLDAGVGLSAGSKKMLYDRNFGGEFFFSPTAGAGIKFGKSEDGFSLFARWLHHSNAGFFPPNEGIDSVYLMLGYRF